jgi:hypothetical protein
MTRDDIQKLLGGYATGTLTPEEQQALFEAALSDQELFDALAREEALREVMADPAARAQLLAAASEAAVPWYRQWWRPLVVVSAVVVAAVGIAVYESDRAPKPVTVAETRLPRFQAPPAEARSAAVLPPPPQVKQALPEMKALRLPEPAPPPAPAPAAPVDAIAPQPPMMQSQQQQQMFRQVAPVPLRGRVTDPTGAAVPSATVTVQAGAGDAVSTATNDRGEFSATAQPGENYQLSVSRPGFRTEVVNGAAPANGAPEPVNVRLNVGAAAETVEVTAQARPVVPSMRAIAAAAPMMKAASPIAQYALLRNIEGGAPIPVAQGATVPAGAALTLRATPTADGTLRVTDGDRTIATATVRRGIASSITLPVFQQRGRVELKVYLSSQETPAATLVFNIR